MTAKRKYEFSWDLLGNLDLGRPNLGPSTRLEVYRLMQFCFRDVMEQHLGTAETDRLFYEAGKLAGLACLWCSRALPIFLFSRRLSGNLPAVTGVVGK